MASMNYKKLLLACQKRNAQMVKLRKRGWKVDALAAKYGITKQRVSQIIRKEIS